MGPRRLIMTFAKNHRANKTAGAGTGAGLKGCRRLGALRPSVVILQRNYQLNGYWRFKFSGCLVSPIARDVMTFKQNRNDQEHEHNADSFMRNLISASKPYATFTDLFHILIIRDVFL